MSSKENPKKNIASFTSINQQDINNEEQEFLVNHELITSISQTLTLVLEENKKLQNYKQIVKHQSKHSFSASTIPSISLYNYLKRIQGYSNINDSTLVLGLIYTDRICELAQITLTYYNIHRLLFCAILAAIKYNEDVYYENSYYAQIAGIKNKELKRIEYDFLSLINFNLFVHDSLFTKYHNYLHSSDTFK